MRHRQVLKLGMVSALAVLLGAEGLAAAEIAGLKPSERPGAPVITTYVKTGDWYNTALKGISKPYPLSLKFLDDQGAWFTPFTQPGMLAPYDIRDLHAADQPNTQ